MIPLKEAIPAHRKIVILSDGVSTAAGMLTEIRFSEATGNRNCIFEYREMTFDFCVFGDADQRPFGSNQIIEWDFLPKR